MLMDGCLPVLARRNRVKCTVATRESYRSVLPTSPAGCSTSRNSETCRLPNSQYFRITRCEREPCRDAPEFDVLLFLLHAGKKAWLGCTLYIVVRKERRRKKGGLPCPRSSLSRRCSAQGWSPVNLPPPLLSTLGPQELPGLPPEHTFCPLHWVRPKKIDPRNRQQPNRSEMTKIDTVEEAESRTSPCTLRPISLPPPPGPPWSCSSGSRSFSAPRMQSRRNSLK